MVALWNNFGIVHVNAKQETQLCSQVGESQQDGIDIRFVQFILAVEITTNECPQAVV